MVVIRLVLEDCSVTCRKSRSTGKNRARAGTSVFVCTGGLHAQHGAHGRGAEVLLAQFGCKMQLVRRLSACRRCVGPRVASIGQRQALHSSAVLHDGVGKDTPSDYEPVVRALALARPRVLCLRECTAVRARRRERWR